MAPVRGRPAALFATSIAQTVVTTDAKLGSQMYRTPICVLYSYRLC